MRSPGSLKAWTVLALVGLAALSLTVLSIWRNDILQALLNPQLPYTVYRPPPPPDYRTGTAWALDPGPLRSGDPHADVFFIHPTTFDGGRDWNGPIDARAAARVLTRDMLPNYAGPFASSGRLFAPRYRQASLYASLTLFDDALEAREFAYGDVRAAFAEFITRTPRERPFLLVGVEQGGTLGDRLLREVIAADPALRRRLVAAYLIEAAAPAADHGSESPTPACDSPARTGCVLGWTSVPWLDFGRAQRIVNRSVVWGSAGHLVGLTGRPLLCVNPLLGRVSDAEAPARLNLGAANATGLEWGTRPGFMARQVGARCLAGVLRISRPRSASLLPSGGWARRLRVAPYNLFWADLEADAQRRLATWFASRPLPVSPPR